MSAKTISNIDDTDLNDDFSDLMSDLEALKEEAAATVADSNVRNLDEDVPLEEGDSLEELSTAPIIEEVQAPTSKKRGKAQDDAVKAAVEEKIAAPAPAGVSMIPMPSRRGAEAQVNKALTNLVNGIVASPKAAAAASKNVAAALLSVTTQMDTMSLADLSTAYSGGDNLGAAAWVSQAAASYYGIQRGIMDWKQKQKDGIPAKLPLQAIQAAVAKQFETDSNRKVSPSTVYAHSRIWEKFFLGRKYVDPSTSEVEGFCPWQALDILVGRAYFEYALLAKDQEIAMLGIFIEKKLADPKYTVRNAYEDAQKVVAGASIDEVAAGENSAATPRRRVISDFDLSKTQATMAGQIGSDVTDYLLAIYQAAKALSKLAPPATGYNVQYIWRSPDGRYALHSAYADETEKARLAAMQGRTNPIHTIVYQDSEGSISVVHTDKH